MGGEEVGHFTRQAHNHGPFVLFTAYHVIQFILRAGRVQLIAKFRGKEPGKGAQRRVLNLTCPNNMYQKLC
jgi:hypothetical protein